MTGIRLVAVGLQLVAFWLVLLAIQSVGTVVAVQKEVAPDASHWWAALPASIFLALAVILWFFPRTIATKLYGAEKPGEEIRLSPESLLRVGCCLLGLWAFSTALPALGRIIALAFMRARVGESPIPEDTQLSLVFVLAHLGVAFMLTFRSRTIYLMTLGREARTHIS